MSQLCVLAPRTRQHPLSVCVVEDCLPTRIPADLAPQSGACVGQVRKRVHGHVDEHVILPAQSWQGFAGDSVHAFQQHVISHLLSGSLLETAAHDYLKTRQLEELVYRSAREGRKLEMDKRVTAS